MSMHKLTAGSGYDYLTRQVAALDSTEKGHTGLAAYYSERGEKPGVWIGSGMAGIDGLNAGDPVTAEQMRALFGAGMHPLAEFRIQQFEGPDLTERDLQAVTRLGAPFKILDGDVSPFRVEVAKRIAAINQAAGLPGDWPVPAADRARVRTEVAREFFTAEHGREPVDARELAGQIAKGSRPRTQSVAGYDLTFSPVKSVSTLWAVADPTIASVIERAHQAAVQDALRFIEEHALFTRTGPQGIRQVNVTGMVATAFTHRDSRAGDPDLHTHVAVANKVQTLDGRWLSIDGRVLFKAKVAASETYNTALEQHLHGNLGVRFAERLDSDLTKRPIREIVGVDPNESPGVVEALILFGMRASTTPGAIQVSPSGFLGRWCPWPGRSSRRRSPVRSRSLARCPRGRGGRRLGYSRCHHATPRCLHGWRRRRSQGRRWDRPRTSRRGC